MRRVSKRTPGPASCVATYECERQASPRGTTTKIVRTARARCQVSKFDDRAKQHFPRRMQSERPGHRPSLSALVQVNLVLPEVVHPLGNGLELYGSHELSSMIRVTLSSHLLAVAWYAMSCNSEMREHERRHGCKAQARATTCSRSHYKVVLMRSPRPIKLRAHRESPTCRTCLSAWGGLAIVTLTSNCSQPRSPYQTT